MAQKNEIIIIVVSYIDDSRGTDNSNEHFHRFTFRWQHD